jgi:hypothetical protein
MSKDHKKLSPEETLVEAIKNAQAEYQAELVKQLIRLEPSFFFNLSIAALHLHLKCMEATKVWTEYRTTFYSSKQ